MTTKTLHLKEFLAHCIRDYAGDYAFIKEAVATLQVDNVHPINWEVAQLNREYVDLLKTLTNLEQLLSNDK